MYPEIVFQNIRQENIETASKSLVEAVKRVIEGAMSFLL
jgi:hypothetical protein